MKDKITQAVNEWYFKIHPDMGVLKITPKEEKQLITQLKKVVADEIEPIVIGAENCLTDEPKKWAINDLKNILKDLKELKAKLVGK